MCYMSHATTLDGDSGRYQERTTQDRGDRLPLMLHYDSDLPEPLE